MKTQCFKMYEIPLRQCLEGNKYIRKIKMQD